MERLEALKKPELLLLPPAREPPDQKGRLRDHPGRKEAFALEGLTSLASQRTASNKHVAIEALSMPAEIGG